MFPLRTLPKCRKIVFSIHPVSQNPTFISPFFQTKLYAENSTPNTTNARHNRHFTTSLRCSDAAKSKEGSLPPSSSPPPLEPTLESSTPPKSDPEPTFAEKVLKRLSVRNQVFFFLIASLGFYRLASSETARETEKVKSQLIGQSPTLWNGNNLSSVDLWRFQQSELVKSLRGGFTKLSDPKQTEWIPALFRPYIAHFYVKLFQPYADAGQGKRLCWKICLLNMGVYVLWKIPTIRWQQFMARSFMHNPLSGLSYTMLTSTFSHRGIFHLLLNCLAIEGFGSAASNYFTIQQRSMSEAAYTANPSRPPILESTPSYHFLAFLASAGMFSSLCSHIWSAKVKYPKMIKEMAMGKDALVEIAQGGFKAGTAGRRRPTTWAGAVAASTTKTSAATATAATAESTTKILPSLGISGAAYACVTVSALAFPNAQIALAIPPSYPIDIQTGVAALIAFDMIGLLRGWRVIDHAAHLGGAAFGAAYYYYGPLFWFWQQSADSYARLKTRQQ